MKKFFKTSSLTLSLLIATACIPTSATAKETSHFKNNNKSLVYCEDNLSGYRVIEEDLVGTTIPESNSYGMTRSYGYTSAITGTYTTKKTVYVTPTGQPSGGYRGKSGASVFFFSSGGKSTNFSITVDYKNVTLTAETGSQSSYGSGYSAKVPSSSGNYKFQFIKYYTIKTQKTAVYKYGVYQYTYYSHSPSYSLGHRWVRA